MRSGNFVYFDNVQEEIGSEHVMASGALPDITILHLIYQQKAYEGHAKDYEFSGTSMREHWQSGYERNTYRRHTALIGLGCVMAIAMPIPAHTDPTPVAVVGDVPEISALHGCIGFGVAASGPILTPDRLVDGLEFRIGLSHIPGSQPVITVTALLKPDIGGLTRSHDDDPEAQPAAAAQFYSRLRVHVGTRAWLWRRERERRICQDIVSWIQQLRSRPIRVDRIGSDGEALH